MSLSEKYAVKRIPGGIGARFIREHHYTKGCHNGPMTWGLFDGDRLIGVIAFATPSSEAVRASIFGPDKKDWVTELHRLVILDETPKNAESFLISRGLKGLKEERPKIHAVLSFADQTEGHRGTIYQATNALYLGMTGKARFWRDQTGRLRHPRQNGHNVTPEEANAAGWISERRNSKHRYLFLLPDSRKQMKEFKAALRSRITEYPKSTAAIN